VTAVQWRLVSDWGILTVRRRRASELE